MPQVPHPSGQLRAAAARACCALALFAALAAGCTEAVRVGHNIASGDASTGAGTGGDGFGGFGGSDQGGGPPTVTDASAATCIPAPCGNMGLFECGNCMDDGDGDGLVDAADPECLGPCDDDEAELMSGMPVGTTGPCNVDCYFDLNAGFGDDGCRWSLSCDPLSVAPDFFPTGRPMCGFSETTNCNLPGNREEACRTRCEPITPNGCDCFGCCELPAHSGHFVWLGSDPLVSGACEPEQLSGPNACPPCTPVGACDNPCEECELCVGKTTLPAACGGALPTCGSGQRPCDPAQNVYCSELEYCVTGCCAPLPQ